VSGGDLAQPVAFSSAAILGRLGDTRMNVASNQAKAEQVADATLRNWRLQRVRMLPCFDTGYEFLRGARSVGLGVGLQS